MIGVAESVIYFTGVMFFRETRNDKREQHFLSFLSVRANGYLAN